MSVKFLTGNELERLIQDNDFTVNFVEKKKTLSSSDVWQHFHQVFVHNVQQRFVACNQCKSLLAYTSANGTKNMKCNLNSCIKTAVKSNNLNQTTIQNFYSSSNPIEVPKKIKMSVTRACVEFVALDARAFETIKGSGFLELAQVLFDAGRSLPKSRIQMSDLLPNPTTVKMMIHLRTSSLFLTASFII